MHCITGLHENSTKDYQPCLRRFSRGHSSCQPELWYCEDGASRALLANELDEHFFSTRGKGGGGGFTGDQDRDLAAGTFAGRVGGLAASTFAGDTCAAARCEESSAMTPEKLDALNVDIVGG